MESDNFGSQAEQGIAEYNSAISKVSDATPTRTDSTPLKKKTFAVRHPQAEPLNMPSFEDILKNKTLNPQHPIPNAKKEFVRKTIEKISDFHPQDRSAEIPSFDLGQQILAGQRKASALKRKSPLSINDSSKTSRLIQSIITSKTDFAFTAPASPQQRIITDIVAKEILILSSAR